ncbi:MAG TPA: CHRD domain-containing protein [Anaeromyxobacteraceae bacterium]|nr:CHRD domain-containing protein [Anaeromyxobacteraceae bacterium]
MRRYVGPAVLRSVLVAVLALVATVARAQVDGSASEGSDRSAMEFDATLTGVQETPAIITTGSGSLKLTLHDDSISFVLTFSKLEAPATVSHIHVGQVGVAGGIAAFLCGGGGKPACPAEGGTVSGTITAEDVVGPTAQGIQPGQIDRLIIAMRDGVAYVNVHSKLHPEGEIRGQIHP